MNLGLFEIALLVGSAATLVAGATAAMARRRTGWLLALNAVFAACFTYFVIQGLRFGPWLIVAALAALALAHVGVASAIVARAEHRVPTA
jgi:hypothetical protein